MRYKSIFNRARKRLRETLFAEDRPLFRLTGILEDPILPEYLQEAFAEVK
jgi:hypothetical protein